MAVNIAGLSDDDLPRTATTYCSVQNARQVVLVVISATSYDMFWAKTNFLIFVQGSRWDLPGEVIDRYPNIFNHHILVFFTKIHQLTYCFRILSLTGTPIGAAFSRLEDPPSLQSWAKYLEQTLFCIFPKKT